LNTSLSVLHPKVLLVGPSFSGGGAEGHFANLAKYLFGGMNDVVILANIFGDELHIAGNVMCLGWRNRFSYPRAIWLVQKQLRRERYDVMLAFGLFPGAISILAALCAVSDTKLIICEITRPKMETLSCDSWHAIIYNIIRKWLYRRTHLIAANSNDGLKETCELVGVPVEKGVRVGNVMDTEHLSKKGQAESDIVLPQGKYIICVARLDFMKRIDTVVDAIKMLSNHINCYLVIVGDGAARKALDEQVKENNLQTKVIFTGRLDNPMPVLKGASAFVLASEYEGFSNSVLEAMFCDVPVITSLCSSDACEMCEQGAALGFVVGEAAQLSEHIAAIITDEMLGRDLVSRARKYRASHAMEQAIPIYEDMIRHVAGHVA
jgi:glycosyltransferase involved in cell wall biosynthesis